MAWYLELDLPGAFQAALIRQIVLSLPSPSSRIPDQSIILSDTHEPKKASVAGAGENLVSAMRGDGWIMVHLPLGGEVQVSMSKGGLGDHKWRAWWIDPRTGGREVFESGERVTEKSFKAPSSGDGDDDWLLLVEEDKWM